jgi:hypothetical protein
MHNASQVQLGATKSNIKAVDSYVASESTFEAGLCVHLTSAGALTLASASGSKLGISLGKSLSASGHVSVCRKGLLVPILLTDSFTPVVGAQVHISDTTGRAGASGAGFTGVNAVYRSAVLTGIKEDGVTTVNVALIDFPGGL